MERVNEMNSQNSKIFQWQPCTVCDPLMGEGNGTLLQYSCLENPMDGGAWKAAVHGVAEGRTRLSGFTFTFHFHALEKEMAPTPVFLPGESQGRGAAVPGVSTRVHCRAHRSSLLLLLLLSRFSCVRLCATP